MSLAGLEAPNTGSVLPIKPLDGDGRGYNSLLPFKVDDDEDDISLSIEKLKMQVSALLGDDDCKDMTDTDPILSKDKATCSTSELEMIRRERNRMHAKKTRLRKKKMIQEMETVSALFTLTDDHTFLSNLIKSYIIWITDHSVFGEGSSRPQQGAHIDTAATGHSGYRTTAQRPHGYAYRRLCVPSRRYPHRQRPSST